MNIRVMYHSQTGNTKKVAEAIADAVGTLAEPITEMSRIDSTDLLFIGDGIYGGKLSKGTEQFIKSLNGDIVKNAAVFGTYGGQRKALESMQSLIAAQGIQVADEPFGCRGKSWWIMNRKSPTPQDLSAAKAFANKIQKSISSK